MLLVLIFHAESVGGRFSAMPDSIGVINRFFSPYFITTFMFVSGMMLASSRHRSVQDFLISRFREIAWPYALWSILFLVAAGRFELPWSIAAILLVPPTYLWYLWFLLVFQAIARLSTRLSVPAWTVMAVAWAVSFGPDIYRLPRFALLLIYFMLGYELVRRRGLSGLGQRLPRATVAVAGILTIVFGVLSALRLDIQYNPYFVVVPVFGFTVACVLAQAAPDLRAVRAVEYVGRHSLVFYVVHFTVMWIVDREIVAWGWGHGWTTFGVGLTAAVLTSVALVHTQHRSVIARLLVRFPRPSSHSGAPVGGTP